MIKIVCCAALTLFSGWLVACGAMTVRDPETGEVRLDLEAVATEVELARAEVSELALQIAPTDPALAQRIEDFAGVLVQLQAAVEAARVTGSEASMRQQIALAIDALGRVALAITEDSEPDTRTTVILATAGARYVMRRIAAYSREEFVGPSDPALELARVEDRLEP